MHVSLCDMVSHLNWLEMMPLGHGLGSGLHVGLYIGFLSSNQQLVCYRLDKTGRVNQHRTKKHQHL